MNAQDSAGRAGRAEAIAQAVLYEGYILYPYRPSSTKNRQRWTFGGIFPRSYSEAQGGSDAWRQQTQCLVRIGPNARLDASVRFLHLVSRQIYELDRPRDPESGRRPVQAMRVGDKTYYTWEEAVEREMVCPSVSLPDCL